MERKDFLRSGLGLLGVGTIIANACNKNVDTPASTTTDSTATGTSASGSCITTPTEEEGPYPYPGGEIKNPLQRVDIVGGQTGLALTLTLTVVNVNDNCNPVEGVRVDIWHCNASGYYSGYANQNGGDTGTKSYSGETWLRGYQLTDANGQVSFTTIYPGWYTGRATHIHFELFVNSVLKKQTQLAFSETVSDKVHVTSVYATHGINTTRNASDHVFGDSATDLANETLSLTGSLTSGYAGSYTFGLAL